MNKRNDQRMLVLEYKYFLFQLIRFVIYTSSGASQNARFKALETVSITISWLTGREKEIEQAFNPRGQTTHQSFNKIFQERSEAKKILNNPHNSDIILLESIKNYAAQLQKEKGDKVKTQLIQT